MKKQNEKPENKLTVDIYILNGNYTETFLSLFAAAFFPFEYSRNFKDVKSKPYYSSKDLNDQLIYAYKYKHPHSYKRISDQCKDICFEHPIFKTLEWRPLENYDHYTFNVSVDEEKFNQSLETDHNQKGRFINHISYYFLEKLKIIDIDQWNLSKNWTREDHMRNACLLCENIKYRFENLIMMSFLKI